MQPCDLPGGSLACDAADALVSRPFAWLAEALGHAAAWTFTSVWAVIDDTTSVTLTSPAYLQAYNLVFGIAVYLAVLLAVFQLLGGLLRRDPRALPAAAGGLAKSLVGSFLAVAVTTLLLETTDQLTVGLVTATGTSMEQLGERLAALVVALTAVAGPTPGANAVITIILAVLAITGAVAVWLSLLLRKALVLVSVVLAPIALAGASWSATRSWVTRWASFVVALVVSKLVVVVVFLVGTAQLHAPATAADGSLVDPLAGVVVMFIAAFAPYMTHRFLAFAGLDIHQLATTEREAGHALTRPVPAVHPGWLVTARSVLPRAHSSGAAASTAAYGAAPSAAAGAATAAAAAGAVVAAGPAAATRTARAAERHSAAAAPPEAGRPAPRRGEEPR